MNQSFHGVEIRRARLPDIPELADILARSFDGPVTAWHVPDASRRVETMYRWFAAGLEHVFFPHGEVYTTSGEIAGCCIWMPPGADPIRDEGTARYEELCEEIFRDFPETFELFAIMDKHHPSESRYYLPFIGVDPQSQRRGVGRALLAPVLTKCDREHIVAFLHADLRSKPYHERNGFEILNEMPLPDGLSLWSMERRPGRGAT